MSALVSKKGKDADKGNLAEPTDMLVEEILVEAIEIPPGRRTLDPNWVEMLAEDIAANGQRAPIEVVRAKIGFRLISGAHRLSAISYNSGKSVFAIVREPEEFASQADIKLREIAENFMRRELSVLDRAMDVAAWREIYEAAQGTIKPGRKSKKSSHMGISVTLDTNSDDDVIDAAGAMFTSKFTDAARSALKLSQPGVFRALKISTISAEARTQIALHPMADNQSELLALAKQSPERQRVIAALISAGDVANVAIAIVQIDDAPPPVPLTPFARISEKFSRLKTAEQNQFFDLHVEAIELWLERRGK